MIEIAFNPSKKSITKNQRYIGQNDAKYVQVIHCMGVRYGNGHVNINVVYTPQQCGDIKIVHPFIPILMATSAKAVDLDVTNNILVGVYTNTTKNGTFILMLDEFMCYIHERSKAFSTEFVLVAE